jgi:hypothetical protein
VTKRSERVGSLNTRLVIFHSDWSSGSRLSSTELHWSFLHSLSWWDIDLSRLPERGPATENGCSETLAYKIQTLGNNPEKSIQHSEHGESLKSRKILFIVFPRSI